MNDEMKRQGKPLEAPETPGTIKDEVKPAENGTGANAAQQKPETGFELTTREEMRDFFSSIGNERYKAFKTGLDFFDTVLDGGLTRQTLTVLIGAPGAGKTALALQLAIELARQKTPVLYYNLETGRNAMMARAFSYELAKRGKDFSSMEVLRAFELEKETPERFQEFSKHFSEIFSEWSENMTSFIGFPEIVSANVDEFLTNIKSIADKRTAAGLQVPVIFLDYLHLLNGNYNGQTQELIKDSVKRLKDFAVKYDTFVIAIAAANRDSNKSADGLTMYSARDSSAIEYGADYMLTLEPPKEEERKGRIHEYKLKAVKNRWGQAGKTVKLQYVPRNNIYFGEEDTLPDELSGYEGRKAFQKGSWKI